MRRINRRDRPSDEDLFRWCIFSVALLWVGFTPRVPLSQNRCVIQRVIRFPSLTGSNSHIESLGAYIVMEEVGGEGVFGNTWQQQLKIHSITRDEFFLELVISRRSMSEEDLIDGSDSNEVPNPYDVSHTDFTIDETPGSGGASNDLNDKDDLGSGHVDENTVSTGADTGENAVKVYEPRRQTPSHILFLPNMSSRASEKDLADFATKLPCKAKKTFVYMSNVACHGFIECATVEDASSNLEFINSRDLEVRGKRILAEFSKRKSVQDRRTYESRQHNRKDREVPERRHRDDRAPRRRSRSPPRGYRTRSPPPREYYRDHRPPDYYRREGPPEDYRYPPRGYEPEHYRREDERRYRDEYPPRREYDSYPPRDAYPHDGYAPAPRGDQPPPLQDSYRAPPPTQDTYRVPPVREAPAPQGYRDSVPPQGYSQEAYRAAPAQGYCQEAAYRAYPQQPVSHPLLSMRPTSVGTIPSYQPYQYR